MKRKNLIIVRAGAHSLHSRWLESPYIERTYDLVISYYDEGAYEAFQDEEGVTAVLVNGGKWDGLFQTLSSIDIEAYEYFWLPDDDISASADDINSIFCQCRENGLSIAQPALTHDSYYSHFLFSQCSEFRLRYTNYIEIMVPCLERNVLKRALPFFEHSMSGFGLDYIWTRWPESGAFRAAILDTIAVHHTRPVGKVLKSAIAASRGLSAIDEEHRLRRKFSLTNRIVPLAFAGILTNGKPIIGRIPVGVKMCHSWWKDRATFREPYETCWSIIKIARRQFTKRLEMGKL